MVKLLFQIGKDEEVPDWEQCRLVLEVGRHFSYCLVGPDNRPLRLAYYEISVEPGEPWVEPLQEIFCQDEVLSQKPKEVVVAYNFPQVHLIPGGSFDKDFNKEYLEMLHGDLSKGTVIMEEIRGWNYYNVFQVPVGLFEWIQDKFPGLTIRHYYSLWMECLKKQTLISVQYIAIIFYPNRVLVAVIKNHLLQLVQEFNYEVAEDVSYCLLNICELCELPPATVPVKMAGMLEESSVMYAEIQKYFGNAGFDQTPASGTGPGWTEFPPHFFSPVLKLSVCV